MGLLCLVAEGAGVFFHVVNTRYERGHPTLVTTNRGLPAWGEVFGDAVVAGAIPACACRSSRSSTWASGGAVSGSAYEAPPSRRPEVLFDVQMILKRFLPRDHVVVPPAGPLVATEPPGRRDLADRSDTNRTAKRRGHATILHR